MARERVVYGIQELTDDYSSETTLIYRQTNAIYYFIIYEVILDHFELCVVKDIMVNHLK